MAFVSALELDAVATALLGAILKGGSAARATGFNPRKTQMNPQKATARAGLNKN